MKSKWDEIPDDVDILMTHGPPYGKYHNYQYTFNNLSYSISICLLKNCQSKLNMLFVWMNIIQSSQLKGLTMVLCEILISRSFDKNLINHMSIIWPLMCQCIINITFFCVFIHVFLIINAAC